MSDEPQLENAIIVAQVTITRYLLDDDLVDHAQATAADGNPLGLAEALGMLTLAQHTLIDAYAEANEDDT